MLRKIIGFLLLAVSGACAHSQTGAIQGHSFLGGTQAKVSGLNSTNYLDGIIPHATITVYLTGTTTLATIYSNASSTPLSNPFTSNNVGSLNPGGWIFWAATGQGYDIVASGGIAPNTYPNPVTLCADCFPSSQFSVTGGVTEIIPGTDITCSPNVGGNCIGAVTVNSSAGGLCPGGSTFSLQYNASSTTCGGDTAVTDGAGNIYSPNGSFTTTASYQGFYMFGEGSGAIITPVHAPTNYVAIDGPTSGTIALWLDLPGTSPSGGQSLSCATPTVVNGKNHSVCSWITPGSFTAGGDLSGSSSSQEVIGLHTVPFCSGFTPTNGQAVTYSTGLSPNPCYTAATPSGGSIDVNGSSVSSPNFNAATPAAPGGNTNCTWQVSGSSVSCYVPTSSGGSSFPFTTVQETPLICAPSSNNCVFTFPETTAASGDTDLLFCGSDGSLTLTAPSGWTLMFDQTTGTSGGHVTGYSKASASDTAATVGLGTSASVGLMACQFMEIVGSHSFDQGAGGNGAINASPPNLVQFVTFPSITPTAGAVVYGVVSYGANRDLFTSVLTTPNWKVFGMSNDNGSFGRSIVGLASTIAATATATTPPPMPLTNSTNSVVAAGFPIAWETFSIK